jgi:hypothetical protein
LRLCDFATLRLCDFATLRPCDFATLRPCDLARVLLNVAQDGDIILSFCGSLSLEIILLPNEKPDGPFTPECSAAPKGGCNPGGCVRETKKAGPIRSRRFPSSEAIARKSPFGQSSATTPVDAIL